MNENDNSQNEMNQNVVPVQETPVVKEEPVAEPEIVASVLVEEKEEKQEEPVMVSSSVEEEIPIMTGKTGVIPKPEDTNPVISGKTGIIPKTTAEDYSKVKKNNGKGLIIILILLLIVFGVLCVIFGPKLFKSSEKKKDTETIETDTKKYHSEYRLSGNGLEDFDLYFLQLENEAKNKVYSPLSIKYALAMLNEGTAGESHEQIESVIGDYKAKKYNNNEHMSFANAMFIRNTIKDSIKDSYTTNLKEKYDAEVILDDFASPDNINNWVKNKTFNLVDNLVERLDDNIFFLVNALAIDMNWNNQVHCVWNRKIPCVNNGRYEVEYKHEKLEDDAKVYYSVTEYPYSGEEYFFHNNKFAGQSVTKGASVLADFNKYDIIGELGEDKIREIIKPEYEEWLKTKEGANDLPVDQIMVKQQTVLISWYMKMMMLECLLRIYKLMKEPLYNTLVLCQKMLN